MSERHAVTTTLTEWACGCGHHGVFITVEQRKAFEATMRCPYEALDEMRAKATSAVPVDWAAVRRASDKPVSERTEHEQALVDAFTG